MLGSRIEMGELAELAALKASRTLRIDPVDLPRLARMLLDRGDSPDRGEPMSAEIRFDGGGEQLPRVQLTIAGSVSLECQRCLQAFECPIEIETVLTVASDEDQVNQIGDPFDSILVDGDGLDIEVVIEDEILAALPFAPVHGPGSECADRGKAGVESRLDAVQMNKPFEELGALIGRADKDRSG
jgi:uncharacterized protein